MRLHPAVWFVPAAMLTIGVLTLPYGYYRLMRLVVSGVAVFLAYKVWDKESRFTLWLGALTVLALLFNPFVPVHLNKACWRVLNPLAAAIFIAHWWKLNRKGRA